MRIERADNSCEIQGKTVVMVPDTPLFCNQCAFLEEYAPCPSVQLQRAHLGTDCMKGGFHFKEVDAS